MASAPPQLKSDWLTFHVVYAFLFAVSAFVISVGILLKLASDFLEPENYGAAGWVYLIPYVPLVIIALIHQFLIYNGLHAIETNTVEWSKTTGGWAGSRWERPFRLSILIIILAAVSKIAPVFALVELAQSLGIERWWLRSFAKLGDNDHRSFLFLLGVSFTHLLFVLWCYRALAWIKLASFPTDKDRADAAVKIKAWLNSDWLAFIIWSLITIGQYRNEPGWNIFAGIFVLLYFAMFLYRVRKPELQKVEHQAQTNGKNI